MENPRPARMSLRALHVNDGDMGRHHGEPPAALKTDGDATDPDATSCQANPRAGPWRTDPPQFHPQRLVPKTSKEGIAELGVANPGEDEPRWPVEFVLRLIVARPDGVEQHPSVVTYDADSRVGLGVNRSGLKRPRMPDDEFRQLPGVVLKEPHAQRIPRVDTGIGKDGTRFRELAAATGTAKAGRTIARSDEMVPTMRSKDLTGVASRGGVNKPGKIIAMLLNKLHDLPHLIGIQWSRPK